MLASDKRSLMPHALMAESSSGASDVAVALRCDGFEPLSASSPTKLVDVCTSVPLKSLDCYIKLADDQATVVLVIGDRAVDEPSAEAVDDLTRVLARALRDYHRATAAPAGSGVSPDVAASGVPPDVAVSYADLEPALGFAEWRLEVLSLLETT
jgi:hypothetical protein